MTAWTLLQFLVGSRDAILRLGADPWSLAIGALLVFSAALARSYDSRDLRHESWHLWLPFAASTSVACVLYLMLFFTHFAPAPGDGGFLPFLALVWLTAPLGWLYALPYQRFLGPRAVRARLIALAVVSAWRVALTMRVVQVMTSGGLAPAVFVVILAVDLVFVVGFFLTRPKRTRERTPTIIEMMAGVTPRVPAEAHAFAGATGCAGALALFTLPLWVIGVCTDDPSTARWALAPMTPRGLPALSTWIVTVGAVIGFCALSFRTQPPQRRRWAAERLLAAGSVREAVCEMARHERAEYPQDWRPPPWRDFRDPPPLLDIMRELLDQQAPQWLWDEYLPRFRAYVAEPLWYWFYADDLKALVALLRRTPDGPELARVALAAADRCERKDWRIFLMLAEDSSDDLPLHPPPSPEAARAGPLQELRSVAGVA